MTPPFNLDTEAARISFAGTLVALRATGVDIVEARFEYPSAPILKIVPEQIMAGFDIQKFGNGDLELFVDKYVRSENPSMVRRMILAQVRAILAGRSALEYADITGALNLVRTPASEASEVWAQRLLDVLGASLDYDQETKEVLFHKILSDADRVIGKSWDLVGWVYTFLQSGNEDIAAMLQRNIFTKNTEEFPITAASADSLWKIVEEEVADLVEE